VVVWWKVGLGCVGWSGLWPSISSVLDLWSHTGTRARIILSFVCFGFSPAPCLILGIP
jgi:hypothetical protein